MRGVEEIVQPCRKRACTFFFTKYFVLQRSVSLCASSPLSWIYIYNNITKKFDVFIYCVKKSVVKSQSSPGKKNLPSPALHVITQWTAQPQQARRNCFGNRQWRTGGFSFINFIDGPARKVPFQVEECVHCITICLAGESRIMRKKVQPKPSEGQYIWYRFVGQGSSHALCESEMQQKRAHPDDCSSKRPPRLLPFFFLFKGSLIGSAPTRRSLHRGPVYSRAVFSSSSCSLVYSCRTAEF